MSLSMKNNLNIWEFKEYSKWYRIDLKIGFFFRKIKWMFQRAKYGCCDRDIWSFDYTLGNYLANSLTRLADTTHGYPYDLTEKEWDGILRNMAYNFYMGVNEDCWENSFDRFLTYENNYNNLTDDQKKLWDEWFNEEKKNEELMKEHRDKGFQDLEKWFTHLWD